VLMCCCFCCCLQTKKPSSRPGATNHTYGELS
jgi:hypothetical protein